MPTIGVAVAVPEPWGTQLQAYRSELGDETAARIPTHITLVPPLQVGSGLEDGADAGLEAVHRHLDAVAQAHRPFSVHLRGTGSFRPVSPVVFVAVVEGISECEQLADGVRRGPLAVDLAFPYHPHVTVAHDLPDPTLDLAFADLADFECHVAVDEFHLYVHDDHRGWEPTRSFTLREPATAPRLGR